VQSDAGLATSAAARGHGDVKRVTLTHDHLPFDGGGQVTQARSRAASENSGNEAALPSELLMAERVHTAPQPLQPPRRHPMLDRAPPKPAGLQLPKRDHPPLASREVGNDRVQPRWLDFSRTVMGFSRHPSSVAATGPRGCCCL
jgi:hypothetical protein